MFKTVLNYDNKHTEDGYENKGGKFKQMPHMTAWSLWDMAELDLIFNI